LIANPARQPGARPYLACFATPGKQFALRLRYTKNQYRTRNQQDVLREAAARELAERVAGLVSSTQIK
jgi:hypothetical protein